MNEGIVTIERAGVHDELVYLNLEPGAELPSSFTKIEETIHECFKNRDIQIIINMNHVKLPPAKFIALLVEATNQARRMGGDIKLVNASMSVRNNLMTFSALTYLSIEESEQHALYDFDQKLVPFPFDPQIDGEHEVEEIHSAHTNPVKKNQPARDIVNQDMLVNDKIRVRSKADCLYQICDFVTGYAEKAGLHEIGKIKVTVYEACLNVIEHAYFSNPDHWIEVTVKYNAEHFFIIIHDWGQGFQFHPERTYDVELAVKDRKTGGFGLYIIQRSVDDILYDADPVKGNRLTLIKNIDSRESGI